MKFSMLYWAMTTSMLYLMYRLATTPGMLFLKTSGKIAPNNATLLSIFILPDF